MCINVSSSWLCTRTCINIYTRYSSFNLKPENWKDGKRSQTKEDRRIGESLLDRETHSPRATSGRASCYLRPGSSLINASSTIVSVLRATQVCQRVWGSVTSSFRKLYSSILSERWMNKLVSDRRLTVLSSVFVKYQPRPVGILRRSPIRRYSKIAFWYNSSDEKQTPVDNFHFKKI